MLTSIHRIAATPPATPTPYPTYVFVPQPPHVGATVATAGPWQMTLPLLFTLVVAVLAVAGVLITVGQKHRSDQRQQLWNRIEWVLDAVTSPDPSTSTIGALAASYLAKGNVLPRDKQPPAKLTAYDAGLLEQALYALYEPQETRDGD